MPIILLKSKSCTKYFFDANGKCECDADIEARIAKGKKRGCSALNAGTPNTFDQPQHEDLFSNDAAKVKKIC